MIKHASEFMAEVTSRLTSLTEAASAGEWDDAVSALSSAIRAGGVIQVFGTGHSQAFAMELSGRAGGLIPTNKIALSDLVFFTDREVSVLVGSELERDETVVEDLWSVTPIDDRDIFVIVSNSGVNGSIVGMALEAKRRGHTVIAVTSMAHTLAVSPKHASGKRLCEIADLVIDNLAPYGDTVLELSEDYGVGAVSSITGAHIAQLLTVGVVENLVASGQTPPLYISANKPGGDEHNRQLEERYSGRMRRLA